MIFLRVLMAIAVGMIGSIFGVAIAQSTLAAWSVGAITCGLVLILLEGGG